MRDSSQPGPVSGAALIMSVGHSTRSIQEFLALLKAHGVKGLVDVRTVPHSRRNPQFNRETLPATLEAAGIGYSHLPELGGLRHPRPDSQNTAWRNASFRGYADYMQTSEFAAGLRRLLDLAHKEQVVIMCAEAVPWRCHRSLIADALLVHHVRVEHITSATRPQSHEITPWVEGGVVTYPSDVIAGDQQRLLLEDS
jgi:uncharacterized protein (DUF488 family)